MIWRDSVKRNALRLLTLYSPTLIDVKEKTWCCFIDKESLYKVLNVGVPIIVAHVVSQKNNYFLMTDFFQKKTLLQLKVGLFSFYQCEIKLLFTFYSSLPGVPILPEVTVHICTHVCVLNL